MAETKPKAEQEKQAPEPVELERCPVCGRILSGKDDFPCQRCAYQPAE